MQNFVQEGRFITLAASPGDVEPGQGVVAGKLFGVAANAADTGAEVVIATTGVFTFDKVLTDVFDVSDDVYFDDSVKAATADDTGTVRIGVAIKAAGGSDTTIEVRLSGAW
jgi:predicted RecA/RadA family phage recombinase